MSSYTLDTNVLIYHLDGEKAVHRTLERWLLGGDRLFISAITRLEVLAAPVLEQNEIMTIQALLEQFILIPVDARVADAAASIRRLYRIKLGDSIIAATAYLMNSVLLTRNTQDFKQVENLQLLDI